MPEKAKVAVFEDDKDYRGFIEEFLQDTGHTIVAMATTFPEALALAQRLSALGVEIAILDANLTKGENDGSEGQTVLRAIRELAPHVKVIGMSGVAFRGVDFDLGKINLVKIGETIDSL
jgi:CheY-like chemotaxis protein